MTKKEFIKTMIRGWKGKAYTDYQLFPQIELSQARWAGKSTFTPTKVCAMGAFLVGQFGGQLPLSGFRQQMFTRTVGPFFKLEKAIINASNEAGSKEKAIASIKKIRWSDYLPAQPRVGGKFAPRTK